MTDAAQDPIDPTQKLSPEQKEAVEVFVSTLPCWRTYYVPQLPSTIFENNARYFTPISLKKDSFPREPHWTWNRSNGTIVIDLYNQFRVKLTKYNSRRRKNSSHKQPSYKLWSYAVTVLQTNEKFAFIWCTKGRTRASRGQVTSSESLDSSRDGPRPIQIHPSREQLQAYPTQCNDPSRENSSIAPPTPATPLPLPNSINSVPVAERNAIHSAPTPQGLSFTPENTFPQPRPGIWHTESVGTRPQPATNPRFAEPAPAFPRQADVPANFSSSLLLSPSMPCTNQPDYLYGKFDRSDSFPASQHPYGWV